MHVIGSGLVVYLGRGLQGNDRAVEVLSGERDTKLLEAVSYRKHLEWIAAQCRSRAVPGCQYDAFGRRIVATYSSDDIFVFDTSGARLAWTS